MMSGAETCPPFGRIPWLARLNVFGLAAILAALSLLLLSSWIHDPDQTHGLFVPVLFLILLLESRRYQKPRFFDPGGRGDLAAGLLGLASLATLGVAGVYAAVLGWSHALVEFLLAASAVCLLGTAWLALADRRVRWISVSWPAAVAIVLWLLAAPLPPGTYSTLALQLQNRVTSGVVESLEVMGIPAHQSGNVIELARSQIGVSEACSGVRSLISCLATGLFFSAVFAARAQSRAVLLLAAPLIAVALNFVRSLFLALIASRGISIAGEWHAATGLAIITLTSGLLALIAWRLGDCPARDWHSKEKAARGWPTRRQKLLSGTIALNVAVAFSFLFLGLRADPPVALSPRINLEHLMPPTPPGWRVRIEGNLAPYQSILQTDTLADRTYWVEVGGKAVQITLYLAYWRPGQAPVSLVAAHTPDVCWPGTGWEAQAWPKVQNSLGVNGRILPEAQSRLFTRDGLSQYVWFWHLWGGRPLTYENPYSLPRLFHIAAQYGFAPSQDQLFVRVSSNRPWDEISSQPVVQSLFAALRPQGL
jgi:exosortase